MAGQHANASNTTQSGSKTLSHRTDDRFWYFTCKNHVSTSVADGISVMQITNEFRADHRHGDIDVQELHLETQLRSILNAFGGLSVDAHSLSASDDLFAAGLTSFATVGVMLAMEEEFGVAFPDALLVRATFSSIESLAKAVSGVQTNA